MTVIWIALGATVVLVIAVAAIRRLAAVGQKAPGNPDLGNVSEGWLSENRSRKDP